MKQDIENELHTDMEETKTLGYACSRTSASLVKINSTYKKHKAWPRQPCCTASPVHRAGTVQTGTGKVYPARKFICTTAARVLYLNLLIKYFSFLVKNERKLLMKILQKKSKWR